MAIDKPKILAAAQKHLGRGNVDRALKELAHIVRDDPKDLRVRQKVAELLARQGNIVDAMREFSVVAEAYERGGFFPKAAAIYKQMLRFEPNSMHWHLALGEIYQQLALLSDAADHFNIVANHYDSNGIAKERIEIYERLVRMNPDSLEYAERLSELYQRESDPASAYEVWSKVARVLQQRNDADTLITVYERMSALREDDLDLVRSLANLYLDRKDPRRALSKLQQCFKADPQDTETLNLLADAFVDLGEREKAVAVLRELAQIYQALGYAEYRDQVNDRIADLDPRDGANYQGDARLVVEGLENPLGHVQLDQEGAEEEVIVRPLIAAATFIDYGFPDRARDTLEAAVTRFPSSFALRRAIVPLLLYFEDSVAAQHAIDAMYEIAMDHSDYVAAKACLVVSARMDPEDEQAAARLRAFDEALGDFVPDPAARDTSMEDFGDAIELGQRIAGTHERVPDPMEEAHREVDDFDFDAREMQALARKLEAEMDQSSDGEDPFGGEDLDLDLGDDPLAGLDLDDLGDPALSSFDAGMKALDRGDYEAAVTHFQAAVQEPETLVGGLEMLGLATRHTQDYRTSVECFRRLLAEKLVGGDDQLRILYEIGLTYEAAGSRKSAWKVYKRIVGASRDFRNGELQNRLSSLELELGLS